MNRKTKPKTSVQTYRTGNQLGYRMGAYFLVPLIFVLMEGLAWFLFQRGYPGSAAFFAVAGALFLLPVRTILRARSTVVELHPGGVGLQAGGRPPVFLEWEGILRIKEGVVYPDGWFIPGLYLLGPTKNEKIGIPYSLEQYDAVRDRVLREWAQRKAPVPLPRVFHAFPFGRIVVEKGGLRLKRWFKTRFFPWAGISRFQWGFRFLLRAQARYFSFLQITLKDGRTFRIHGRSQDRLEMEMTLKKFLGKAVHPPAGASFGVLQEKLSHSLWRCAIAGTGWALLPGLYLGKCIGLNLPSYVIAGGFGLVVFFAYFMVGWGLSRWGLVASGPRPPKTSAIAAGVLPMLFLFVPYFTARYLCHLEGMRFLNRAKAEVRAAGYDLEGPANAPKLADGENAAIYLKKSSEVPSAYALLGPGDKHPEALRPFFQKKTQEQFLWDFQRDLNDGKLTPEEMVYGLKLVQAHAGSLQLLDKAYQIHRLDWGMDFTLPYYQIEYPPMAGFLDWSRLLAVRALFQARAGKAADALTSLKTALFLGEASQQSKTLIGEMIDSAICGLVLRMAPSILERMDPRLVEREFLPALQPEGLMEGYRAALQFDYFGKGRWKENAHHYSVYRPFGPWDAATYYEGVVQKLNALALPFSQRSKAWDEAKAAADRNQWFFKEVDPNAISMLNKVQESVAYCRLARLGTEARLFRLKTKRWPGAVWELVDQGSSEGLDPFSDGDNLRIMGFGNGILIYSLGPGGADNQGQPKDEKLHSKRYNPAWTVKE